MNVQYYTENLRHVNKSTYDYASSAINRYINKLVDK